jgi:hypothetical protein
VVGIVLLGLLIAASQRLVAESSSTPDPTREELCAELDDLMAAASGDALFATQEINHQARKLSRLADAYEASASAIQRADGDQPPVAQAGDDIRWVLRSVAWETSDLVTATRPIALECGWTWPLTTAPPAAQPRSPS